jgi:DNA polymerase III sliding clamp (beta) subunit (PCNA family)
MEFRINTVELQRAIRLLGVSAKPNSDDISERISIEAENDKVKFLTTNTLTSIEVESPAEVLSPGESVIKYGKIVSFVTSYNPWSDTYGAKDFLIKDTKKGITISVDNIYEDGKVSKGLLKLATLDSYRTPKPRAFENDSFILNSGIFKSAISKVVYAVGHNQTQKTVLQGMFIQFDKDSIYFAGANGRLLSEYKISNPSSMKEGHFIFRHDGVMALKRALGEETQMFWDVTSDKQIKVRFDNVCFWGRKIVGHEFPVYRNIFDTFENKIVVEKKKIISSIYPMLDVLDDTDNNRLSIEIKDGELSFYCPSASITCDTDIDFKDNFKIDINGRFLKETIEPIADDIILIKFSSASSPLIFDSANFENQKAAIMPVGGGS